jgi:hypothetical protein
MLMMAYTLRNVDLQIGIFYFVEIYKETTIINTIFLRDQYNRKMVNFALINLLVVIVCQVI